MGVGGKFLIFTTVPGPMAYKVRESGSDDAVK
jgi:hypothetical protein